MERGKVAIPSIARYEWESRKTPTNRGSGFPREARPFQSLLRLLPDCGLLKALEPQPFGKNHQATIELFGKRGSWYLSRTLDAVSARQSRLYSVSFSRSGALGLIDTLVSILIKTVLLRRG